MLGQYKCAIKEHNDNQVQGICQNKYCRQPQRRICFECIKLHQKNDQQFDLSDIKNEKEIQLIIHKFQEIIGDRMDNISLQCQIQKCQIVELQAQQNSRCSGSFARIQNNEWKQINIQNYIDNERQDISIYQYLQQYQQQLFNIDDKKDNYIKNVILQQKYNDVNGQTEQNNLSIDIEQKINKYNNQLLQNIISNDLFKQKHKKNEEYIITICELMLRQGYDLKTDTLFEKFQLISDKILDQSQEKYKQLYIQSYAIAHKQQVSQSQGNYGFLQINQSLKLNEKYSKSFRIKGFLLYLDKQYIDSIKMYDEAIKLDTSYVLAYRNSLVSLQKYEQAIEMYDQAIKFDPKFALAYFNKGNCLFNLDKFFQAIEMYDVAIQIDPKYTTAYYNKADALFELKNYQQSKEQFYNCLNLDPNDDDTKERISNLSIILEQCDMKCIYQIIVHYFIFFLFILVKNYKLKRDFKSKQQIFKLNDLAYQNRFVNKSLIMYSFLSDNLTYLSII
ncbi:hypothetical protein pb186bvf_017874 [Paramecium bursaria]